jgi:hypothetical protein
MYKQVSTRSGSKAKQISIAIEGESKKKISNGMGVSVDSKKKTSSQKIEWLIR